MKKTGIYLLFFSMCLLFLTSKAVASVPQWQIVPNNSSLTFTATQNNAPVTGQFKTFTGEIYFDPTQLNASHVRMVIDMNSVSTSYKDLTETLVTTDWFNVKLFPQAVFTAKQFTKINGNNYQATGDLTIRDKTIPTTLQFTLDEYSTNNAHVKGTAQLKRLDFGVGQGEWKSTDEVKNEVQINFNLSAARKY